MTDFLQAHPDGVILAIDQMSLYFQATTTRVWSPVGQTPTIAVSPQRACRHFYGALNLRTGREIALPALEQSSAMTVNFLMILLLCYPHQPILLLLDRAPWHYGEVPPFIAEIDRLQLIRFPTACPDLNPQEHVWEQARDAISHHHAYQSFPSLLDEFETFLNETLFDINVMDKYVPPILCKL